MFIVFQIPLSDSRSFIGQDTYSLKCFEPPDEIDQGMGDGSSKIPFTRSFGLIHKRSRGGSPNWDNEDYFGQSRRAVRFQNKLGDRFSFGPSYSKSSIKWVSRRLFCSGITAHLDIDFKLSRTPLDEEAFEQTLLDLMDLPIRVPHINSETRSWSSQGEVPKELKSIGSVVALRLLYSTTKHGGKPEKWWISAGNPFLIVELDKEYLSSLPEEARRVYQFGSYDIDLYYYELLLDNYPNRRSIDVWILAYSNTINSDSHLHETRINISRFITERKCLQIFLSHIKRGRIRFKPYSVSGQALQDYLKASFDLMEKGKGLNFSKRTKSKLLIEIVHHVDSLVHPGDYPTLLKRLSEVRHNLLRQIKKVVEQQMLPDEVKNFYLTIIKQQGNFGQGANFGEVKTDFISGIQEVKNSCCVS